MFTYKLFVMTQQGTIPMFMSSEEAAQVMNEGTTDLMSLLSGVDLDEDDYLGDDSDMDYEGECDCEDRDCENCHH